MKNKIIKILLTLITVTTLTQCTTLETRDDTKLLVNREITEGLTIDTTADNKTDNIEIYYTRTQADFDRLTEVLENRNGKIIIEVSEGVILDKDGNGSDCLGNYIKYGNEFSVGDKVQSIFIYNPENNAIDDIIHRYDRLIE